MKCPHHPRNEVVGYCSVCGDLGCDECIHEHEGDYLCSKHYRPIARELEAERKHENVRKRRPRQRLVARFSDGRIECGVCFSMNIKEPVFHLDLVDNEGAPTEESVSVPFRDLKAVFFVKSFDGNYDKTVRYKELTPEGGEMVVKFQDGEIVRGFSLHKHNDDEPRFYLIPGDPSTNNISILVERSAIQAVCTPEEYEAELAREREERRKEGRAQTSQEESMGDFYFQSRNYEAALEQYRLASEKFPQSVRLRKKVALGQYNVGVQHIKRRDYAKALACMEIVLKLSPDNEHALKKVSQLRRILEKER